MAENPPAFPRIDNSGFGFSMRDPGMSLRDYFAGQIAPSLLQTITGQGTQEEASAYIAIVAYDLADAMLAEREKRNA